MSRSNDIAGLTTSILDGVTAAEVGLGNVTNESKATMFTSPTFTGTTNVSSGVTLPSNPTIALGSNATFPAGHVVQVKQVVDDTVITRTGDKSSWAAVPGMSVTLDNNVQSGSKLLASYSGVYGEAQGSWWAVRTWFTIYQNSTNVIGNQVTSTRDLGLNAVGSTTSSQNYWNENFSSSVLFTPTGTDAAKKTVSLYWKNQGSDSFSSYLNNSNQGSGSAYTGGACVLTLMEISG